MKFPMLNFTKFVDKNGELTSDAKIFLEELIQLLQQNLSDEGYLVPKQSASNVTTLDNDKSNRTLLVKAETGELLFNLNGTFKTVQLA